MIKNPFHSIAQEELDVLPKQINGLRNPIYYLFDEPRGFAGSPSYSRIISFNTKFAISLIESKNDNFILKSKGRLLSKNNISDIDSSLGEIRCYGYLIEAFGRENVEFLFEKSLPTPDFAINLNGKRIIVETNTIQPN